MPFYLRKSLSFGPLRFNLSNSGIGVSTGVKGFRVGAGPRGNYIHAGRGGFYYRSTLSEKPVRAAMPTVQSETLTEIESGDVSAMRDADSAELLAELERKRKLCRWGPTVLVVGLSLIGSGWLVLHHQALVIAGIVAAIAAVPLWMLDVL